MLVFTHPGFRRLWLNSVFSDAGTIVLIMAQGLLALELTGSEFWLGAVAGVNGIAIMSFSLVGGVMADRFDRRVLVAVASVLDLAVAALLGTLVFLGVEALWHLLALAVVSGISISIRAPARSALTLDLVGRDKLIKATAANFAALQFVAIIAPLSAGRIIDSFDVSWAYVVVATVAGLALLSLVGLRGVSKPIGRAGPPLKDMLEGARYVFRAPTVRTLILLAIVAEIFAWSHETMLPVMATFELNAGASGLGYIIAAGGVGALVTTIVISSVKEVGRKGIFALIGLSSFGGFLILFALSPWLPLSLIFITLAYSGAMAYETMLGALLQTVVPDEMRGRVLSFQTATWGLTGVAGFHTGAIAAAIGAPIAIAIGGAVVLVNGFRVAPTFRRLDERAADEAVGD